MVLVAIGNGTGLWPGDGIVNEVAVEARRSGLNVQNIGHRIALHCLMILRLI